MAVGDAGIKDRLEHGTQRRIARKLKLSEAVVSEVVTGVAKPRSERGRKTVRRVQVAIARALRTKVDELFPLDTAA